MQESIVGFTMMYILTNDMSRWNLAGTHFSSSLLTHFSNFHTKYLTDTMYGKQVLLVQNCLSGIKVLLGLCTPVFPLYVCTYIVIYCRYQPNIVYVHQYSPCIYVRILLFIDDINLTLHVCISIPLVCMYAYSYLSTV